MPRSTGTARHYRISDIGRLTGLTPDTLRYYERIGLLPRVARQDSGARLYDDKDLSRLRFIQRAKMMDFTLAEIGALLRMREAPQAARQAVRRLTARKLEEIEKRLGELAILRDELRRLLELCTRAKSGCPIIEDIEAHTTSAIPPERRRAAVCCRRRSR
jgi:DNA-binding transcriptional MerR regulator